jgi:hypothetical protein
MTLPAEKTAWDFELWRYPAFLGLLFSEGLRRLGALRGPHPPEFPHSQRRHKRLTCTRRQLIKMTGLLSAYLQYVHPEPDQGFGFRI